MKVVLLGEGAALHALAWKLVSETEVTQLHCAPGNAGTLLLVGSPPFAHDHAAEVTQWAFAQQVDLVVVQGRPQWVETLTGVGLPVIGVGERGWQALRRRQGLREQLQKRGVAVVTGQSFHECSAAERYLASRPLPLQLRLDDSAQREAVRVTERYEAFKQLARLFTVDPEAGICIEEEVEGTEVILQLLGDGQRAIACGVSRPYCHRYEGEAGPLTEGMGAYAPCGDRAMEERLLADVGRPVVAALADEGLLRPAFLQLRIVLGPAGPVLRDLAWDLDPLHAAVTLPRLGGDLCTVLQAAALGRLGEDSLAWSSGVAVAVALVSEGYPGLSEGGQQLHGLYEAEVLVFQHATRLRAASDLVGGLPTWLRPVAPAQVAELPWQVRAAGGFALLVVGRGATGPEARHQAYEGVERLRFERSAWRKDIAQELE